MTRKYKRLSHLFFWLSIILTFLPVTIVAIMGCVNGSISIENKLKLSLCVVTALFLLVLGVKSKYRCRSLSYLMLFGCYFVTAHIQYVVLIAGICCIIDEFMISPLHKYFHNKLIINKEIDKRM